MIKLTCVGLLLAWTSLATAVDGIAYDFSGKLIWAGKNSSVTLFQQKLSEKLVACGKKSLSADGAYGNGTQAALKILYKCDGYQEFADGPVTFKLWDKMFEGKVFYPSVQEQAITLILSHIGSDFNKVKWINNNMVWFPFKARVGRRINQIGGLLDLVFKNHPNWAPALFGRELGKVKSFIKRRGPKAIDYLEGRKNSRVKIWWDAIRTIAADPRGRETYIQYAFQGGNWYRPSIDKILEIIGIEKVTEIDYAFAMDLSTGIVVTEADKKSLITELDALDAATSSDLTSAEIRQIIARKLTDANDAKRVARNVVYYIDLTPLSRFEKEAWTKHSRLKASSVGLKEQNYEPYLDLIL